MLVAHLDGQRIEARNTIKGLGFSCPNCSSAVILKSGRIKITHFAHKAKHSCEWAAGETQEHLAGKVYIHDALVGRYKAELECVSGDRRADIMLEFGGRKVAIELQHTSIGIPEIEERANDYAKQGIAQLWMPLLSKDIAINRLPSARYCEKPTEFVVGHYSPRPFEKWIHGFHGGKIFYYQPGSYYAWEGKLSKHEIEVPVSEWYEPGGIHVEVGGYKRISKRWRTLTLKGPIPLFRSSLIIKNRNQYSVPLYNWPACGVAELS